MGVIKAIIEKFKLKELIDIIFVAAIIITIIPKDTAITLNILKFREKYQTYISLCLIITGAYYIVGILIFFRKFILGKIYNWKRTAINYMKNYMSPDEMGLLIETFYDRENNSFKTSGMIEYSDGRKAALESKHVLYRASSMSEWYAFAYNLQPYVRDYLNMNLQQGNIRIMPNRFEYVLK